MAKFIKITQVCKTYEGESYHETIYVNIDHIERIYESSKDGKLFADIILSGGHRIYKPIESVAEILQQINN